MGIKGEVGVDSMAFLSNECLGLKNHIQNCHISKKTHVKVCRINTVNAPFVHLVLLSTGGTQVCHGKKVRAMTRPKKHY